MTDVRKQARAEQLADAGNNFGRRELIKFLAVPGSGVCLCGVVIDQSNC
jgi:hypothetical protein